MSLARAMIDGMRPSHWIKNIFLFAAMPFGEKLFSKPAWYMGGLLFVAFCGLASAVYLINDLKDRHQDRLHDEKRKRAIASGRLPVSVAIFESVFLIFFGMAILNNIDKHINAGLPVLVFYGAAYLAINIVYTLWMKNIAIMDIMLISTGFIIRVVCGANAVEVPASPWLVLCTFTLSLFISITKRRSELRDYPIEIATELRRINAFYTPERLEHMLSVAASLSIMSYCLYCISPQIQERMGSLHMVWTIPFVVYGIFRYYCLSGIAGYGDTIQILIKDKVMWLVGIGWIASVLIIIYRHKIGIVFGC